MMTTPQPMQTGYCLACSQPLDPNQQRANRFPLTCCGHDLFYPEPPDQSHDSPPPCDEPAVYRYQVEK